LIGKFGEGFKIAALVLLRGYDESIVKDFTSKPVGVTPWEPKNVYILNDDSKWSFYLQIDAVLDKDRRSVYWKRETI
jgi:hypothetical protein